MLLLDEPAAGVPREESGELFAAIAGLSKDITVLFIEHDMDLVFRFASRIIVMVAGGILVEGTPQEIAADAARARGLPGRGAPWLKPCSTLEGLRAGYGEAVVLDDVSLELPPRRQPRGPRPQRRRQVHPAAVHHGPGTQVMRGRDRLAREPTSPACRPTGGPGPGLGWVAQEREIFPSLTVEENLTVAARPGRWDLAAVYRLFPRLAERRGNMGNQLSGGEQQMLAIARALMTNPALLLLDEPLEGLAPIIVEELAEAIRRMLAQEGTAVILVEQHAELALSLTRDARDHGARRHRAPRRLRRAARATPPRSTATSASRSAKVSDPPGLTPSTPVIPEAEAPARKPGPKLSGTSGNESNLTRSRLGALLASGSHRSGRMTGGDSVSDPKGLRRNWRSVSMSSGHLLPGFSAKGASEQADGWMPGTSPGMTRKDEASLRYHRFVIEGRRSR